MSKDIYVKAGDKVRCITKFYEPLIFGEIYTVEKVDKDYFVLEGFKRDSWTNPLNRLNNFELYKENKTFNKGDKIKVIGKIGDYKYIGWAGDDYIGRVGIVSGNRRTNTVVKIKFDEGTSWYFHVDSLELVEDNPSMEQTLKKLQEDIIKISGLPSTFFQYSNMTCVSLDAPIFTNKKRSFKKL